MHGLLNFVCVLLLNLYMMTILYLNIICDAIGFCWLLYFGGRYFWSLRSKVMSPAEKNRIGDQWRKNRNIGLILVFGSSIVTAIAAAIMAAAT